MGANNQLPKKPDSSEELPPQVFPKPNFWSAVTSVIGAIHFLEWIKYVKSREELKIREAEWRNWQKKDRE